MAKLSFITFDEKLEASWGLHKIEKAVLEKEAAELKAEIKKLRFERDTIGEANYVNGWNDAINSSEAMQDLRAENEQLRKDLKTAIMGDSAELQDVKRENEKLREALIGLYKPVFENPVEVGSTLDLALRAAAAAIRGSGDD